MYHSKGEREIDNFETPSGSHLLFDSAISSLGLTSPWHSCSPTKVSSIRQTPASDKPRNTGPTTNTAWVVGSSKMRTLRSETLLLGALEIYEKFGASTRMQGTIEIYWEESNEQSPVTFWNDFIMKRNVSAKSPTMHPDGSPLSDTVSFIAVTPHLSQFTLYRPPVPVHCIAFHFPSFYVFEPCAPRQVVGGTLVICNSRLRFPNFTLYLECNGP